LGNSQYAIDHQSGATPVHFGSLLTVSMTSLHALILRISTFSKNTEVKVIIKAGKSDYLGWHF